MIYGLEWYRPASLLFVVNVFLGAVGGYLETRADAHVAGLDRICLYR